MSSTSKRPRPPVCAPGEVFTNWKVVHFIVLLTVLAGCGIGLGVWSAHPRDGKALSIAVGRCEGGVQAVPRVKPHELRREVVVYGRRVPTVVDEIETPPNRRPGSVLETAPDPTVAVSPIMEATGPALSGKSATKPNLSAVLVTLDEWALLRQLGFDRGPDAKLDELSASAEVPLDAASAYRHPKVVDIDLDTEKGTIDKLHKLVEEVAPPVRSRRGSRGEPAAPKKDESLASAAASRDKSHPWAKGDAPADAWLELIAKRADLQGLPYRKGNSCKLTSESLVALGAISLGLGRELARNRNQEMDPYVSGKELVASAVGWVKDVHQRSVKDLTLHPGQVDPDRVVPALVQMMQARSPLERRALVEGLTSINGRNATAALVQRALFDLSKDTRELALKALVQRPLDEIRPHLLAGLRYPWAAIADHAAAALVAVDDRNAAKELSELLDEPDPAAPFVNKSGKWAVRELVRVNHLRSCFLCHAPSLSISDPIRGVVPVPGQRLPQQYYQESLGNFVRADVTYLRQDFSLLHLVEKHETPGYWPEVQRFDYLVRTRELTSREVDKLQLPNSEAARRRLPPDEQAYPQREAVLYALRMLTNQDAGRSAAQWRKLVKTLAK